MQWITRERPKIDRIACPWLIVNFIDPGAEFQGKRIRVLLDSRLCIEAEDDHIKESGAVGVWTKADSVAGSLSSTPNSGASQTTLAYNYNFTQETKIYTCATRIGKQQNAAYSFLDKALMVRRTDPLLGVRHNF